MGRQGPERGAGKYFKFPTFPYSIPRTVPVFLFHRPLKRYSTLSTHGTRSFSVERLNGRRMGFGPTVRCCTMIRSRQQPETVPESAKKPLEVCDKWWFLKGGVFISRPVFCGGDAGKNAAQGRWEVILPASLPTAECLIVAGARDLRPLPIGSHRTRGKVCPTDGFFPTPLHKSRCIIWRSSRQKRIAIIRPSVRDGPQQPKKVLS